MDQRRRRQRLLVCLHKESTERVVPSHLSTQHLYELTQLSTLRPSLDTKKTKKRETIQYTLTHFTVQFN